VSLTPGGPVTFIGAAGAFVLARRSRFGSTPLGFLLASGLLTLLVATFVFPVASVWGTFRHSAGPLIVGLVVAAMLVTDRLVDGTRRRRAWTRKNAWLAPLALALLTFAITVLQLTFVISNSKQTEASAVAMANLLHQQPETANSRMPVITDKPIWLNMTSGLPTLALPAQSPDVVLRLAHDQAASLIVVADQRGPYPDAFRSGPLASCFLERKVPESVPPTIALFEIAQACR